MNRASLDCESLDRVSWTSTTPILKNICERLLLKRKEGKFGFFYPFKPFKILNVAITEWFFHVTCFAKVSLLLFKKL